MLPLPDCPASKRRNASCDKIADFSAESAYLKTGLPARASQTQMPPAISQILFARIQQARRCLKHGTGNGGLRETMGICRILKCPAAGFVPGYGFWNFSRPSKKEAGFGNVSRPCPSLPIPCTLRAMGAEIKGSRRRCGEAETGAHRAKGVPIPQNPQAAAGVAKGRNVRAK